MMRPSTRERAAASKTTHAYSHGVGWIEFEAPPGPYGSHLRSGATPPGPVADGSWHLLVPRPGAAPLKFRWVAAERAWERHGGYRLAFGADYLGSHGWTYLGPADAD